MNTIEQAREVAHFLQLSGDTLRANAVCALLEEHADWKDEVIRANSRTRKAEAELAALKQQEPIATKIETNQFDSFQISWDDAKKLQKLPVGTRLYLAAGAQSHYEEQPGGSIIPVDLSEMQAGAQKRKPYKCEDCGLAGELQNICWCQAAKFEKCSDGEIYSRVSQLAAERTLYNELIFAVSKKYPGETRHETALRYIRQAEAPIHEIAKEQP